MKCVVIVVQVVYVLWIIGVDLVYFGVDDVVIYFCQGLYSKVLWIGNKIIDDLIMVKCIVDFEDQYQVDVVFIDFGYGIGLKFIGDGWGCIWQFVLFGGVLLDLQMLNKCGEMFNVCKMWFKFGGVLDDQEMVDDFFVVEYKVRVDGKIVMELKEDIKECLGWLSGKGDVLFLIFVYLVMKCLDFFVVGGKQFNVISEYDLWV